MIAMACITKNLGNHHYPSPANFEDYSDDRKSDSKGQVISNEEGTVGESSKRSAVSDVKLGLELPGKFEKDPD